MAGGCPSCCERQRACALDSDDLGFEGVEVVPLKMKVVIVNGRMLMFVRMIVLVISR